MHINRLSPAPASFHATISCIFFLSIAISADIKTDMDGLTGNVHTRVVWLRGGDRINGGGKLMGYDSKTNKTTQILAATSGQNRPIICSGGHKVIVSINYKVHVVNWDGTGKKFLVNGVCSDAWIHPDTKKEWIVVREGGKSTSGKLYRHLLENPSEKFLLYDKKPVGIDYFQWWQISADGTLAVDFLPWSTGYIIENGGLVSNGPVTQIVGGCWSSVAPDNSYYWFALTCCPHKTLNIFKSKTKITTLAINAGPRPSGTLSDEFYHPKFASKGGRFLTCSGGYHGNSSSNDAETYFGKFSADYKKFDGWVRMTNDEGGTATPDYTPDAWVGVVSLGAPEFSSVNVTTSDNSIKVNEKASIKMETLDQMGQPISVTGTADWKVTGGGTLSGKSNTGATFTSDGTTGTFIITATLDGKSGSVQVRVSDPSQLHMRLNCGGSDVDDNGVTWEAAAPYASGGADYSFGGDHSTTGVTDPAPNQVYQTVRHQNHSYDFKDVPNGTYTVRIHFTDAASGGGRAMDYIIEGKKVLDGFSPSKEAGGLRKAVIKEFSATVSDGNGLQIGADQDGGNDVFEAGIEIIVGDGQSTTPQSSIALTQPAGGSILKVGNEYTIKWIAEYVSGVTIQVSPDGGVSWEFLTSDNGIQKDDPQWGAFKWQVTESINGKSLLSKDVIIKVADYFEGGKIYGQNSTPMTITNSDASIILQYAVDFHARFSIRDRAGEKMLCAAISATGTYVLQVMNARGRLIHSAIAEGPAEYAWPVGSNAAGVYFINLASHSQQMRFRLIAE